MDAAARIARRLAPRWAPDVWTAICVCVVPAARHDGADANGASPAHFLAAAWPPAARGPTHWPEAVAIGSPDAHRALETLLRNLPRAARLHLASLDDVDAALAAEVLLAGDRNLERYQREGIEAFVAHERARTRAAIAERYTDRDAGYERFAARVGLRSTAPPDEE